MIELLDILPLCLAFISPQMPLVSPPTSPSTSVDAEKQRQAAAQAAQTEAMSSGRASTDVGGAKIRADKQRLRGAGYGLGL